MLTKLFCIGRGWVNGNYRGSTSSPYVFLRTKPTSSDALCLMVKEMIKYLSCVLNAENGALQMSTHFSSSLAWHRISYP